MIEIVFLGTSSMVPTKERNHSAIFINFKNNNILVDCGEGTQRQLKIKGISILKINKILITHWHGDHVLGLPGLIQTLAAKDYDKILEIYGPKGTKNKIKNMFKAFEFDENKIKLKIFEVTKGKIFENNDFFIEVLELNHGISCIGYNFIEKDRRRIELKKAKKFGLIEGPLLGKLQDGKSVVINKKKIKPDDVSYIVHGKKICFILDTIICKHVYSLAKNADLLVCDSTYHSSLEEKAQKYYHMTSRQAALVASKSNVKALILTHISARYKSTKDIEEDAKTIFPNVKCAYDFMRVKV